VEAVDEVQNVRTFNLRVRNRPVTIVAVEMDRVAARTGARKAIAGDFAEMHRLAAAGQGVVASENFCELERIGLGTELEFSTPTGVLRLPIVGVVRDYSGQQGTIFLDRQVFIRHWNSDSVDIFRVYLKPGASAAAAKDEIIRRIGPGGRAFVFFNHELRDYILRITDQWFGMSYVQLGVAVLVAILGIVNTLTVSIADRRRELGVLRAVGGLRGQIRRTIWLEAVTIGVVGLALGLALGAIDLGYELEMMRRDFSGMPLDYRYPFGVIALLGPVILGAAVVASILPAESSVRGSLFEALEYE
ncbi:MAG: ABC transporter permease, partial [Bryobacteraceae bacterium]